MEPRFFPLAAPSLPRLRVAKPALYAWKCAARDEVAALLDDRESWYYRGQEPKYAYKLIYNKKGLEGFLNTSEATRKKEFYAHGILKMYLEDVSFGLYAESTLEQRGVSAFLDEEVFLDAAVLCVDERQTLDDPFHFAGVKWSASASPSGVPTHADMVYFEYSFTTRDADGRAVLVQYITCPDLASEQVVESDATRMLARGKNHQINTFRSDEEGTYCQSMGTFLASEQIPSWVGMKTVLQAFSSLSNIVGLADARAVAGLKVATALSAGKACYLCKKKFSMLRARQNCRSCGHSICKHCMLKLRFLNKDALSTQQSHVPLLAEDKFCLPCVRRAREERPENEDVVSEFVNSIVSESSSNKTAQSSSFDDLTQELGSASLHDLSSDSEGDFEDLEHDRNNALSLTGMRSSNSQRRQAGQPRQRGIKAGAQDEPAVLYEPSSSYYNSKFCPVLESPRSTQAQQTVSPVMAFMAQSKANAAASAGFAASVGPPPSYNQYHRINSGAGGDRSSGDAGSARGSGQFQSATRPAAMYPEADAITKLAQSIAAQEALLHNMEQERQKLQFQHQQQQHLAQASYYQSRESRSRESDEDRFEVISEAPAY